jgi:hypothetical protein
MGCTNSSLLVSRSICVEMCGTGPCQTHAVIYKGRTFIIFHPSYLNARRFQFRVSCIVLEYLSEWYVVILSFCFSLNVTAIVWELNFIQLVLSAVIAFSKIFGTDYIPEMFATIPFRIFCFPVPFRKQIYNYSSCFVLAWNVVSRSVWTTRIE